MTVTMGFEFDPEDHIKLKFIELQDEAYQQGADKERENILDLLLSRAVGDYNKVMLTPELIQLIKRGNK